MTQSRPQPLVDTNPALTQLRWQVRLLVIATVMTLLFASREAGLSLLAGAGIAVIGQSYFVWRAFRHAGAISAKQIVQGFYRGEAGKFMLTAALFATVFLAFDAVKPGWLFTGFILEQLVAWIVPLTMRATQQ